jgi:hypothetical protein
MYNQVLRSGSRLFPYSVPIIVASAAKETNFGDIKALFGNEAEVFDYFDTVVIYNNSALPVYFYLNNDVNEAYYILPYGTQPITRRPFRTFSFYNPDAAIDIAAGSVYMNMRRLPPDVVSTVSVR